MPTTGVYSGNDIAWESMNDDFIDLDYENAFNELVASGMDVEEVGESLEYFESNTQLYGDWLKDENDKYMPDPEGEYAFILNANENTVQVVYSKTVKYGRAASPCYPCQVDARVEDPSKPKGRCWIAYYALPMSAFRDELV
jgi:hypothetical protein